MSDIKKETSKKNADKLYAVVKALTAMKLTKEDSNPGKVFDQLYLGSIGAAYNKKVLDEIGITHILTVAANIKPRFPKDIEYKCFELLDSPN